jgi:hypothetical protein
VLIIPIFLSETQWSEDFSVNTEKKKFGQCNTPPPIGSTSKIFNNTQSAQSNHFSSNFR